jgi:hypothetical protein
MNESTSAIPPILFVRSGEDQTGEHHGLGISVIDFKFCPEDDAGIFILENTFHEKGGPARHLHLSRTSGSMRWKVNSSSKSVRNECI